MNIGPQKIKYRYWVVALVVFGLLATTATAGRASFNDNEKTLVKPNIELNNVNNG
jgi:hypothetical protein